MARSVIHKVAIRRVFFIFPPSILVDKYYNFVRYIIFYQFKLGKSIIYEKMLSHRSLWFVAHHTGNDDNIVLDLVSKYRFTVDGVTYEKGFVGGLLGHWSVWTKKAVELFEKCKSVRGQDSIPYELICLAGEVTDTNAVFFDTANGFKGCIAGLHYVLCRQGLLRGLWCLNPDETMSEGQREQIERLYREYPHLNDDAFVAENVERWLAD